MNILILHQHFRSPQEGGALRSYFLAKALVDRGDNVRVVTGSNFDSYSVEKIDGIEIHHLPVAYSNYFGFWRRIFSFARFVFSIAWHAKKFKEAQICYAISVPLTIGLAARWIK